MILGIRNVVIFYVLFLLTGGALFMLFGDMTSTDTFIPTGPQRFMMNTAYGLMMILVAVNSLKIGYLFLNYRLPLYYLGYITLASLYSQIYAVSFNQLLIFTASILFGYYLSLQGMREYKKVLFRALMLLMGCAVLFLFIYPETSRHIIEGKSYWRGAFTNRNHMGLFSAFFVLLAAVRLRESSSKTRYLYAAMLAVGLVYLWRTGSTTALFACVASLGAVFLLAQEHKTLVLWAIGSVIGLLLIVGTASLMVDISIIDNLLGMLGKDRTLTGRRIIWDAALAIIADNPIFGTHGLPVYFSSEDVSEYYLGFMPEGVDAFNPHSSYLAICVQYGVIGLILYLSIMLAALKKAYQLSLRSQEKWPLGFMILIIIAGISEVYLLWPFVIVNLTTLYILASHEVTLLDAPRTRQHNTSPH